MPIDRLRILFVGMPAGTKFVFSKNFSSAVCVSGGPSGFRVSVNPSKYTEIYHEVLKCFAKVLATYMRANWSPQCDFEVHIGKDELVAG